MYMKKSTIIIVLLVFLVVALAALYAKNPNVFQGSAFQKFNQTEEALPGEEPIVR